MNQQLTEHQIQTNCIHLLKLHGFYVQRMNSGKLTVGEGRARRVITMAEVGTPDILAIKKLPKLKEYQNAYLYEPVRVVWVEVKRPGNKPTIHQKYKMEELKSHGMECYVVHSDKELESYI